MWLEQMERLGSLATDPGALGTVLLGAMVAIVRQSRRHRGERFQAKRLQSELMAYMLLDDWRAGDARAMGRRICRAISRHSAFGKAGLLVRDGTGRLRVTASTRTDDLTLSALERWAEAERAHQEQWGEPGASSTSGTRVSEPRAKLLRLERRSGYQAGDPAALAWCTALIVPMCNQRGRVTGAIAVCADRFYGKPAAAMKAALEPLEVLAARFAEGLPALSADFDQQLPSAANAAGSGHADSPDAHRLPAADAVEVMATAGRS